MHRELELLSKYPFPQSSIPYLERYYLPTPEEEKLWSRTIHVPLLVTPRATYRVREDYYNVFELYSKKSVTIPDPRLIGADVIVFDVESEGNFAIIYEPSTKKKHRVFFKMLRIRNPEEPYLPCTWVYPNAIKYYNCGIAFQTDWKSPERRFTIRLTNKNEWEIKVKTTFSNYNHDVFTFQISDLRECLLAGLTLLSLRYGFWSEEEIALFNVVAQNNEYNLPEIEEMLNNV